MEALRADVQRNSINLSKEAVKRYPEDKELCRLFFRAFTAQSGPVDTRYGLAKYKAIMQRAANHRQETVFVELDDVEEFCRQEHANTGADPDRQQSLENLLQSIEKNTLRYMKFFYEAADAEMPERDEDFNADCEAKDAIKRWRESKMARQRQEGSAGGPPPMPMRLKNAFDVRFVPRSTNKSLKINELTAESVGALVQLDCLVVRVGMVKPKVEVATYHCEVCDAEIFQTVESDRYTPPTECPSERCKQNRQTGKLRCNVRTCQFGKHQEMKVQEMSEHVPVGRVPRSLDVILTGDLTRTILPGDAITITGVYQPSVLPFHVARTQGRTTQVMYLDAHHIRKHKQGYNDENDDMQELFGQIDEAQKRGTMYEESAKSIGPEIYGMLDMKKALLISLVGSFTKTMKDGMKIRGDIHTLFMGDPGVAKSQLLKQVVNIAPRSVYTTGKGSSGVGLTAAVVRDQQTGEVTLEGGALVLADMGICCIDEFDKMEEGDRTAIHEVMEQQSVSVAKAGITTTLNTRTTIIAAANPVYGRYNPFKSPVENMDLPAALLSRFDLLFLLLDTVDPEKDKMLSVHVAKVHSNYEMQKADAEEKVGASGGPADDDADVLNLGFKPFDAKFMRAFVRKAKTFEPVVTEELMRDIQDAYVQMREDEKRSDIDSRKSYTTPRTLLAILRLSQAHARVRFSPRVERQDFDEAMRLMKASKESVELSAPAKRGVNPVDLVYDIVADLSRRADSDDGWVDIAHVVSMAGHKALDQEMVSEAIDNWESINVLCRNPEKTKVKFMVPSA